MSDGLHSEDAGNDVLISKGPCEKCGSSDGNAEYADGHKFCFVCRARTPPPKGNNRKAPSNKVTTTTTTKGPPQVQTLKPDPAKGFAGIQGRGLKADTMKRYGYFLTGFKGQLVECAPYYSPEGELAQQKLRLPGKEFPTVPVYGGAPSTGKCQLFGQHVYGDRFDRKVVVTEGEHDAMAVGQCLEFKMPAVSVTTGAAGALACLKRNYLWLDRFDEIILWFDDDEDGRKAAEECAALFKVGKVKIAKAQGFKDASAVLQANKPGDIQAAVYGAVTWRPKGIVNARDMKHHVLAPREKVLSFSWPPMMEKLQEMTGGIFLGQVVYHVAGTGVGKSAALREIAYHLTTQECKIGILSFEDDSREVQMGLMSIHASERLHLIPVPDPEDTKAVDKYDKKMGAIHEKVFGSGLVELFDAETAEWQLEAIMGYVRYMAKALDCQVIIVDPLSFVAAGISLKDDERRVLDYVAAEFAKLSKELHIHLQVSHHLKRVGNGVPHEEGAPTSLNELRSSGGLANFAMCVIGWERNNQAAGDSWRVTQSRVIKQSRRTGLSGLADVLYYGEDGRLVKSHLPFPPIGKPDGKEERNQGSPFPQSDGEY